MTRAFDVVVVPDFTCERASVFEGRTLFFLASWIENAGQARGFPLHLACIGEPPPSVCWLAAQANASITVHEPVRATRRGVSNKLRGLEVQGSEECLLLLDVDVLVLSDIADLSRLGNCIAAAPACKARVPARYWQKIYPALGINPPTERIASIYGELGYPYLRKSLSATQQSELKQMFPKYNSGVLWLPRNCGLRAIWEDHIRKIAALFDETDEGWKALLSSDEPGLATAIQLLKSRGVPFKRLPDAFHAREPHIAMEALRVCDIKLFHAIRLCRNMDVEADTIHQEPHTHLKRLLRRMVPDWYETKARHLQRPDIPLKPPPAAIEAYILGELLQRLYVRHVAPAWQHARARSRTKGVHQAELSIAQREIAPPRGEPRLEDANE